MLLALFLSYALNIVLLISIIILRVKIRILNRTIDDYAFKDSVLNTVCDEYYNRLSLYKSKDVFHESRKEYEDLEKKGEGI